MPTTTTAAPKSTVRIPSDKWHALCDALRVSPDADLDMIIKKVKRSQELLAEYRKKESNSAR